LIDQYDDRIIRCPRIGGEVNFRFCRCENNMFPCGWIIGCWHERIDIHEFLKGHYSTEELDRIFTLPRPKVESLVNLIEQAKQRKKKTS